jgi:hypothetical protein
MQCRAAIEFDACWYPNLGSEHPQIKDTPATIDDSLYQRALELADPDMHKADPFRVAMQTFYDSQQSANLTV